MISNRDEYLSRPTASASIHTKFSSTPVLCGIDLLGGGTWLGITISPSLKFATLTNYAEELTPSTIPISSRGNLVKDFLTGNQNLEDYSKKLEGTKASYAGFNLLCGELSDSGFTMKYISNREESVEENVNVKKEAVGLSNGTISSNDWIKVNYGREAFVAALESESREDLIPKLYSILTTAHAEPVTQRVELRKTILVRPIPLSPTLISPPATTTNQPLTFHSDPTSLSKEEKEVKGNWYATRTQTLLFVGKLIEGKRTVEMREREAFALDEAGGVKWIGEEKVETFII